VFAKLSMQQQLRESLFFPSEEFSLPIPFGNAEFKNKIEVNQNMTGVVMTLSV